MEVTKQEFDDLQKIKKLLLEINHIYYELNEDTRNYFSNNMSIDGYNIDDWMGLSIVAAEEFFGEDVLKIKEKN